jgi:hypothetical protein
MNLTEVTVDPDYINGLWVEVEALQRDLKELMHHMQYVRTMTRHLKRRGSLPACGGKI